MRESRAAERSRPRSAPNAIPHHLSIITPIGLTPTAWICMRHPLTATPMRAWAPPRAHGQTHVRAGGPGAPRRGARTRGALAARTAQTFCEILAVPVVLPET
eukprot:CAMPEP_0115847178 /NCGR_PEP_ID=MMETSP0287-20121206/10250_1 /TAXON_ID=412157 /ORGANISM="Chrysochromulina rotalis, Strain UIO044" /LENGTH=101 /DNA_ID=CAMNT_0003301007 /DNA_START=258 /DNA_END=559 /DNA_ORIENTATION=-